jgi:hypothetical protein
MTTRYVYELDYNNEWRWFAFTDSGKCSEMSRVGYAYLQDCLHAVGLMQEAPGSVAVPPPGSAGDAVPDMPPELSLSRLQPQPKSTRA